MEKLVRNSKRVAKRIRAQLLKRYYGSERKFYELVGHDVECNICNYKAKKLKSDGWHLNVGCPYCGSGVRLRLLWASLTYLKEFKLENIIQGKRVLHFAPEQILTDLLRKEAGEYKTADFLAEGYDYLKLDYNIDMSDMAEISDGQFDCIIACDVLEHVPNHMKAMREAYRVLSKGGWCIFTIPQKDSLEVTYEDLTITDPKRRTEEFGQFDHWRIYGNDFPSLLESCGFEVSVVDEKFFEKDLINRHVLEPPIKSEHPLATNFRKVFFGLKR